MVEGLKRRRGPGQAERYFGGWRGVASAWAVALFFLVLFAGVQALASRHGVSARQESLAGAMIPRHNPGCTAASAALAAAPTSAFCPNRSALTDAYSGW